MHVCLVPTRMHVCLYGRCAQGQSYMPRITEQEVLEKMQSNLVKERCVVSGVHSAAGLDAWACGEPVV